MNLTLDLLAPDHSGSITAVHATGMAGERMAALGLIARQACVPAPPRAVRRTTAPRHRTTELMIRRADARSSCSIVFIADGSARG